MEASANRSMHPLGAPPIGSPIAIETRDAKAKEPVGFTQAEPGGDRGLDPLGHAAALDSLAGRRGGLQLVRRVVGTTGSAKTQAASVPWSNWRRESSHQRLLHLV